MRSAPARLAEEGGEVPGTERPRLEADEEGVARRPAVLVSRVRAVVSACDPGHDGAVVELDERRLGPKLDAAVRRSVLVDDDARARSAGVSPFRTRTRHHSCRAGRSGR